jgi:flavodoxin
MKKIVLFAIAALTISLTACAQKMNKNMSNERKTLVAYFSATGTTKAAAQKLAKAADADLFEIVPTNLYTSADLDWTNEKSRSSIEMKDPNSRPAITDKIGNWAQYCTIYIGFPVWWYTAPRIINTFMESYDFKGKTVILFATSGGSNVKKADMEFSKAYPDATWKEGKLLNRISDEDLKKWVESNK